MLHRVALADLGGENAGVINADRAAEKLVYHAKAMVVIFVLLVVGLFLIAR